MNISKICSVCGKPFTAIRRDSICCSRSCYGKSRNIGELKECETCGKTFTVTHLKKRYCSLECKHKRGVYVTLICQECGEPFQVKENYLTLRERKYCSRKCVNSAYAKIKCGAGNPNYRGGSGHDRGQNWKRQASLARKRDGYKCQICGKKIGKKRTDHGVHHIKPYRDFDGDWKTANQLSNLITLCTPCHRLVEYSDLPCPVPLF